MSSHIIEYRVCLPLAVDEYFRGQLYSIAVTSREASRSGKEGVVSLKNEPYDNTDGRLGQIYDTGVAVPRNKGVFTLKHYRLASRLPALLRAIAPARALYLVEASYNAYPYCRTLLWSGYLSPSTFLIDVETLHVGGDDSGELENALGLPPEELARRKVEFVDIADAPQDPSFSHADARSFVSKTDGRGPLADGWQRSATPRMCAYKVVRSHFRVWPLQGLGEATIASQQRRLFASTLAHAYVTCDEWLGLSLEQVRALEDEVAAEAAAAGLSAEDARAAEAEARAAAAAATGGAPAAVVALES